MDIATLYQKKSIPGLAGLCPGSRRMMPRKACPDSIMHISGSGLVADFRPFINAQQTTRGKRLLQT
jgi:hypothetical protein